MSSQKTIIGLIDPLNELLHLLNLHLFGKDIKKKDPFSGYLRPFSNDEYVDVTVTAERIKILGSDFPMTNQSARTFVGIFFLVFMVNYLCGYDIFGLVRILNTAKENALFFASLISVLIITIDKVIPRLIFFLINILIRFKFFLMTVKISIKNDFA